MLFAPINVIEFHHQEVAPDTVDGVDLAMLRVADALAQQVGMGAGECPDASVVRPADLENLALRDKDLERVHTHLEDARRGIEDFFRTMA